ncbi:MAG: hypothetical protein KF798_05990 [Candidatus Paracaedibacteraceae bacterium]|nr:hypothetical protein [Candidatus Paracaedibacteraceae bacterium]
MNKLLLLLGIASFVQAEDAPVELDAPAPVEADAETPTAGGDDISNPSPVEADADADAKPDVSGDPEKPATTDEKFDMALSNIQATHPEKAGEFEQAYHAGKDKEKVLADWSNTAIESQDMLDAVDELHAIYQVMKNISPEASVEFEQKIRDEKDPRHLLEYAHQLLLKSLKDRKAQIEAAKEEMSAVTTILQYVDIDAAHQVFKDEQLAEDPRTRVSEAYDKLLESLEKAHKEAGVASMS